MCRLTLFGSLFVLGVAALLAADKAKTDSPKAAATRKKLQQKVTVDFDNTPLKEATDELADHVKDLAFRLDSAGGVSNNIKVTCKADKKPVTEVLDGMFKKNGLGYVVVSKEGDAYDGTILIKQGKERGYAAGEEPDKSAAKNKNNSDDDKTASKAKVKAKSKDKAAEKDKPAKETPEDDATKAEEDANRKLKFAKTLADDGKTDKAKTRLEDIIAKYPKTKAAKEARELLKNLNKEKSS